MKKVELLAPARNREALMGALHAGADAVYLGGTSYGARAYADNFDEEALCRAIFYTHLLGKKIYLTMNTLLRQPELEQACSFLEPYYLAGLDGVIVQDMGLFSCLQKNFPLLELHISTQMAITGAPGAGLMKGLGASRVVLARELSLEEIRRIKEEGIEIETFIHGAMCYCYSGQCLFSSFLGGRSGNRGTCAQACRQPYGLGASGGKKGAAKKEYVLSLKDMCSLEHLPALMEAGIDSFKIEGRMKRPEYTAGVTAIYRKYIDLYLEKGKEGFRVEPSDRERLSRLYLRSKMQDGYYFRYNGPDMITRGKPGYTGTDEALAKEIRQTHLEQAPKAGAEAFCVVKKGEAASLTLAFGESSVRAYGAVAQQARGRALTARDVEKQLRKTGNTDFVCRQLRIELEEGVFLPLGALNELRREAFCRLEEEIKRKTREKREGSLLYGKEDIPAAGISLPRQPKRLIVSVLTARQALAACGFDPGIQLYVEGGLLLEKDSGPLLAALNRRSREGGRVWLTLPLVLRKKDIPQVEEILLRGKGFARGAVISGMDSYGYLRRSGYGGKIALNHHVYLWNRESLNFWQERAELLSAPLECSGKDWAELASPRLAYPCYGRIPMMVTANCVRKTKEGCPVKAAGRTGLLVEDSLSDRLGTVFPVRADCRYCYNIIYNSVPLSLHACLEAIRKLPGGAIRLDFTTETAEEMRLVVREYGKALRGEAADFSFLPGYTTGHFRKGAN